MSGEIVFTKHLRSGDTACWQCCSEQSGLQVRPGYFRDLDVEPDLGHYGVCASCFGTGIELNLPDKEADRVTDYRFTRYNMKQLLDAIATGRKTVPNPAEILAELVDKLKEPILAEEFFLLVGAEKYWRMAGSPTGVYAEELSALLTEWIDKLAPAREISAEKAARFAFDRGKAGAPDDLTPALLADLHDMVKNFGQFNPRDKVISFSSDASSIAISISADPANRSLIVGNRGASLVGEKSGSDVIGEAKNNLMVIWDKTVSVADVRRAIRVSDASATFVGLYDRETGKRTSAGLVAFKQTKFKVDDVFKTPGAAMPCFDRDPEEMRQGFDRPDDLLIITNELGGQVICLKRDEQFLALRKRMVMTILKEMGVTSENLSERMAAMPMADVIQIRERVEANLKAEQTKS